MKRFLISIAVGIILTVLFFFVGAFFSGGGHSLTAMMILFPYAGIVGPLLKDTRWGFIAMGMMAAQFPVYAILLACVRRAERNAVVAIILLAIHIVTVAVALQLYDRSKSIYGFVLPPGAIQQIVGRERRERVSQLD